MALPEIKIVLTAVSDGAKRGVKVVADGLDDLGTRAETAGRRIQAIGDRMTGLGKRLSIVSGGIVAAGAGMFALTKSTADAGDQIAKTARAAGVSGEYFQEMAYAIGQVSDLSEGQFGDALGYMTKRIGEAADGSAEATRALEALGYTQEQIASGAISTEEAFSRFVAKMDGAVSPAIAAALSADLFGRSAASLGPQLKDAGAEVDRLRAEASDLGIVLSKETLKASEEFGDQMKTLEKSVGALKNVIGAALLPILTEKLIPAIQDKVIPALASMATKIEALIQWFGDLPGPVQEAAGIIAAALGIGGPVVLAVGVLTKVIGGLVAASGPIGLFIAAAALAVTAWTVWGDDIKALVGSAVDFISAKFDAFIGVIQRAIDKVVALKDAIAAAFDNGNARSMGVLPEDALRSQGLAVGGSMAGGIVEGIGVGLDERAEELRGYLNSVPEQARDAYQIKSPSRVFAEIGGQLGAGLAQGIADTHGLVSQAVAGITSQTIGSTENMVSGVLGSLGQMFQGSKRIAAAQALVNAWAGATEALKLPFPQNLVAFSKVLATGLGAVRNIQSAQPGSGGGAAVGGAGAAPAAAPQAPLEVRLNGVTPRSLVSGADIGSLLDRLGEEAGDRGYRLMISR